MSHKFESDIGLSQIIKDVKQGLIAEFQKFLRVLYDHTFNPLDAQENLNWIRYEIEKKLQEVEREGI